MRGSSPSLCSSKSSLFLVPFRKLVCSSILTANDTNDTESVNFVVVRRDDFCYLSTKPALSRPVEDTSFHILDTKESTTFHLFLVFLLSEAQGPVSRYPGSSLCILLYSSGSNHRKCNKAIISTNLAHSTCGRGYDVPMQSKLEHHRGFRVFCYCSTNPCNQSDLKDM